MNHVQIPADYLDLEAQRGVSALMQGMIDAWDAGDAKAYADLFTEDATYVMFLGMFATGRDAIEQMHIPVFTQWQKGSRMQMRMLHARQIAPEVVVMLTEGGVGMGDAIPFDKVQSYTLVRTDDGWKCAAFQNTMKGEMPGRPPQV